MDLAEFNDIWEIQRLKSRYFRFVDTKQWTSLRELFTDDLVVYADDGPLPASFEPVFVGADEFVGYLTVAFAQSTTVHHGHMPDIELRRDGTATGVWAMYDWTDDHARGLAKQGFGHYHERYRKGVDGRWRIAEFRLTRLRLGQVDTVSPLPDPVFVQRMLEARAAARGEPPRPSE